MLSDRQAAGLPVRVDLAQDGEWPSWAINCASQEAAKVLAAFLKEGGRLAEYCRAADLTANDPDGHSAIWIIRSGFEWAMLAHGDCGKSFAASERVAYWK